MAKDKANIFKLDDYENIYDKDQFFDCKPGAKNYAVGFLKNILNKETPYVLLLEDKFGMGKTHFLTRFAKYLDKNNVKTIYFSAWENDYINDPFLSFSKELIEFIKKEDQKNKFSTITEELFKTLESVAEAVSFNTPYFSIDCKTIINRFKETNEDPIKKLKKSISRFIKDNLPNNRLVIIVDEIDRCRPDYAMKTLEVIKHFFDIEGLFIIVPSNEKSLNKCIQSLYGLAETDETEWYFNKFFSGREPLYKPDYKKFVEDYNLKDKLTEQINNGKILKEGDKYNSLNTLINATTYYAEKIQLTMRELSNACRKIIYFCKHINKKLYCEYLAYAICNNVSSCKTNKCEFNKEHPFSVDGKKKSILRFDIDEKYFKDYGYSYTTANYGIFATRDFNTYNEIEQHLKLINEHYKKNDFNSIRNRTNYVQQYDLSALIQELKPELARISNNIKNYKSKWASDDNDYELKDYYDNVIRDPNSYLHSEK